LKRNDYNTLSIIIFSIQSLIFYFIFMRGREGEERREREKGEKRGERERRGKREERERREEREGIRKRL